MNIDNMTIGEAKQLAAMFNGQQTQTNNNNAHPFIGKHCIVRTYSAGVHMGTLESVDGSQVILKEARRLWKWEEAFTLNEVSKNGVGKGSRIAEVIDTISLSDMIEIIPTTEKARKSFEVCHEK